MGVIRVKDGVSFGMISPGGFRILGALDHIASVTDEDLEITSGTDGSHSGPDDPHHFGKAFDIRTHGLKDKDVTLEELIATLARIGGEGRFHAFIEDRDTPNEHIHVQVKKGTMFP